MKKISKKILVNILGILGYEIRKISKHSSDKNHSKNHYYEDEHLYKDYSMQSKENKYFFNVGAGNFYHRYWTNIDFQSDWYSLAQKTPFINFDLMACEPLTLDNEIAEIIYTSHTIEHVTNDAVLNLFNESFRVLRKGGGIRITCPDARLFYDITARQDVLYWDWWDWNKHWVSPEADVSDVTIYDYLIRGIAQQRCRYTKNSKNPIQSQEIESLFKTLDYEAFMNEIVSKCHFESDRPGFHINWWDEKKVINYLQKAGFKEIYTSRFNQSKYPPLRNKKLFDNTYPNISLYVEAIK